MDAEGAELPEVSGTALVWLDSRTDESLPGFADSISEGAGFLRTIVGVVLVVVGVLVPFLPFIAVIVALIWWRRRRRGTRPERTPKPEREPRRKRARAKASRRSTATARTRTRTRGFRPIRSSLSRVSPREELVWVHCRNATSRSWPGTGTPCTPTTGRP